MNVSAVSANPADLTQRYADFSSLQTALQTGSITNAQHAFAAFEQAIQKAQATGADNLFAPGSQTTKDLQRLGDALKSSDLRSAKAALANLQHDAQLTVPVTAVPSMRLPHKAAEHAVKSVGNILNFRA